MNSNKIQNAERDLIQIQENHADEYWSKKYGVSTEEMKKTGNNIGIIEKIIEASIKNKSFSL